MCKVTTCLFVRKKVKLQMHAVALLFKPTAYVAKKRPRARTFSQINQILNESENLK